MCKNWKRSLAMALAVCLIVCAFAGCSTSQEQPQTDGDATVPEETDGKPFSGIELVFAQNLESIDKNIAVTEEIIDAWEEQTGASVELINTPPSDYRVWMATQFTANQGPDIFTDTLYEMTQDYYNGYLANIYDYFEAESAYDPGMAWCDSLPESISERMYIDEGVVPGYPTATSVVRIFYNKDLLDQAGAEVPETWAEFMTTCQKLQDSGVIPFGFPNTSKADLCWLWFNNSIAGQLNSELVETLDVSGNGYVELNEIIKGFEEGTMDFGAENMKATYELMKDFSQYWTSDYNALNKASALDMFVRGDVAMTMAMSSDLTAIATNVGDSFAYGVVPVPVVTTETNPNAMGKSVVLGGQPDWIYGLNKALESDPDKMAAAIDFVQYMSSPEVEAKFAEELYRIPLSLAVDLPESLAGFIITEEPIRLPFFTVGNDQSKDSFVRGGQMYLDGTYNVDEFGDFVNESFEIVFKEIKAANGWSSDNNYGIVTE